MDIICEHCCRILALMDEHEYDQCVAAPPPPGSTVRPMLENFTSGYVQRTLDQFPRQGPGFPWELSMDYVRDRKQMLEGHVGDHLRLTAARHAGSLQPVTVARG